MKIDPSPNLSFMFYFDPSRKRTSIWIMNLDFLTHSTWELLKRIICWEQSIIVAELMIVRRIIIDFREFSCQQWISLWVELQLTSFLVLKKNPKNQKPLNNQVHVLLRWDLIVSDQNFKFPDWIKISSRRSSWMKSKPKLTTPSTQRKRRQTKNFRLW